MSWAYAAAKAFWMLPVPGETLCTVGAALVAVKKLTTSSNSKRRFINIKE